MQIFGNQRQIYLLVLCVVSYSAAAPGPPNLDVRTTAGTFRGVSTPANTEKWLGIPFAEQPVGKLRFRAPKPIASPAKGIQVASTFGNACPQPPSATLGAPIGEDCLHLNVRTSSTIECAAHHLALAGLASARRQVECEITGVVLDSC